MPQAEINGCTIYYEDTGGSGVPILFAHGLLWSTRMFAPQMARLRGAHRCIAYDHRGQGRSGAPSSGPIDVETVYQDALALIDHLDIAPCHFVGFSMGGFVALRVAARRPDLLRSCILIGASADDEASRARYRLLALIVRCFGMRPVTDRVMPIMFGRTFMHDPERRALRAEWRAHMVANERGVWRAAKGVIERRGVSDEIGKISVPTLILVGDEDVATPPDASARLHAAIAGSSLIRVPRTGHTASIENPAAINDAIAAFLASLTERDQEHGARGEP